MISSTFFIVLLFALMPGGIFLTFAKLASQATEGQMYKHTEIKLIVTLCAFASQEDGLSNNYNNIKGELAPCSCFILSSFAEFL